MATVHVHEDKAAMCSALGEWIAGVSAEAIAAHGRFAVAVSGGSMAGLLATALSPSASASAAVQAIEWDKWFVFFADERCVALDNDDSNYKSVNSNFLSKVPIPAEQIFTVKAELSPEDMAKDYEARLVAALGDSPALDLALLGMGPDGHTCSLFPGHPLLSLSGTELVTFITDSPKPPPSRITLTLRAVNMSRYVAFVCAGAEKAPMVHTILRTEGSLPCQLVKPSSGSLHWWMDKGAGSML